MTLHPSYFGRNMKELVTSKLVSDVEGTCAGDYYIIVIMDAFDISEGRVLPSTGLAEFTVGYRAVVWRPFKGETVSCGPATRCGRGVAFYLELTWAAAIGRRGCCVCEPPGLFRERGAPEAVCVRACASLLRWRPADLESSLTSCASSLFRARSSGTRTRLRRSSRTTRTWSSRRGRRCESRSSALGARSVRCGPLAA